MPATYLTLAGFNKLQDELEYLRSVKRNEVAKRLHEAMEGGELIENAEYEDAKNEQAFTEGRIQELELILAAAQIIESADAHPDPTIVSVGDTVEIQEEDGSKATYTIVGAAEADPRSGKISNESPLGRGLINHKPGETVSIDAPDGSFKVKILKTT